MNIFKRIHVAMLTLTAVLCIGLLAPVQQANAASLIFDAAFTNVFSGNILVNTHTFKCTLHTSTFSPVKGTMAARSDLTNEVVGTGYTSGGAACTVAGAVDTTNHRYDITVTGPSWSGATISAQWMCVSKNSGTASTDYVIGCIDFGSTITSTASTFATTVSSPFRITN